MAEETTLAWKRYLENRLPGVHVASFASFTQGGQIIDDSQLESLKRRFKSAKLKKRLAQGATGVLEACRGSIEGGKDSEKWRNQPWWGPTWSEAMDLAREREGKSQGEGGSESEEEESKEKDKGGREEEREEEREEILQYLTIGMIGHPNVGKSSLINRMMGRTVVSSSRTPGHTKHFQTLYLTRHLRLCDGPGLVFPSLLPRPLQVRRGIG